VSAPGAQGAFELVVFDCDGVLVDSERVAVRVESELLSELGWPLTEAEVADRFVGRSDAHMRAVVEGHLGHAVDWEGTFAPRYRAAFEAELAAVDGVGDVLAALAADGVPVCVASSSTHRSIAYKLTRTGLWHHFEGRAFSAEDVVDGKPAPDVFLLAARTLGADPARCAVVEDSPAGVEAGRAAGMAVFAYAAGLVSIESLAGPGVTVFDEMAGLPALLGVAGTR
jgi:HAD superfamily hydrolase (TIGR01509 family)